MKIKTTKIFPLQIKAVAEDGTITGYASVFGNKDSEGDVIVKGAFSKTINLKKAKWPILWQHSSSQPVGVNKAAEEDEHGLKVVGAINIESVDGKKAYDWAKFAFEQGLQVGLSIGFQIKDKETKDGIRYIKEIALWEYSIVTFPANSEAELTGIKSDEERIIKAMDFDTALQNEMTEQELWDMRYTIQCAQGDAICSVLDDTAKDSEDKKNLIAVIFDQYSKAMVAWWSKYVDYLATMQDDSEQDSAEDPTEIKAGAKISSETKQVLGAALDMSTTASHMYKQAYRMHTKAASMIHNLVGSQQAKGSEDDLVPESVPTTDPPAPPNRRESDPAPESANAEVLGLFDSLYSKMVAKN